MDAILWGLVILFCRTILWAIPPDEPPEIR
jgi:hypothetical protein